MTTFGERVAMWHDTTPADGTLRSSRRLNTFDSKAVWAQRLAIAMAPAAWGSYSRSDDPDPRLRRLPTGGTGSRRRGRRRHAGCLPRRGRMRALRAELGLG